MSEPETAPSTTEHPLELLQIARRVAAIAAAEVRHGRGGEVTVAETKSSDVDVVTEVDTRTEDLVRSLLARWRPHDAILGEEGGSTGGDSRVRWVVDPIDGTVNFLYDLPAYSVSIAAQVDGVTVAGVVVDIALAREYAAARGYGATRNGTPIQVRPPAPAGQHLLVTGFSYGAEQRRTQAAALVGLIDKVRDIRRFGSAALDLCRVAEGSADIYAEEGINTWDFAAGALIAEEAGAQLRITPGRWGGSAMVAAPRAGFDAVLTLVDEAAFFGGKARHDGE